jgi:hypothetical protein
MKAQQKGIGRRYFYWRKKQSQLESAGCSDLQANKDKRTPARKKKVMLNFNVVLNRTECDSKTFNNAVMVEYVPPPTVISSNFNSNS